MIRQLIVATSLVLASSISAHDALAHSGCACSADVTGNGNVDGGDLDHLGSCLFSPPVGGCEGADVDCDGDVDSDDIDAWDCLDLGGNAGFCCAYILNLTDFPMVEADGPDYSDRTGAVALQMTLNWLHWDSTQDPLPPPVFYDQAWLYDYARSRNANPALTTIDVEGMLITLQELRPLPAADFGYSYVVITGTDFDAMLLEIAKHLGTMTGSAPGHPSHAPVLIPTAGNYDGWFALRGLKVDEPPGSDEYPMETIYGFWMNDPLPEVQGGVGENYYTSWAGLDMWFYFPLTTGDAYDGQYVAIVPIPAGNPIPAVSEWGIVVMLLLILTAGTLAYARRCRVTCAVCK